VEIQRIFWGRTDPLSHFPVIGQTGTETNESKTALRLTVDDSHTTNHNLQGGIVLPKKMQIVHNDQPDLIEPLSTFPAPTQHVPSLSSGHNQVRLR
jgi:hypothetical protein